MICNDHRYFSTSYLALLSLIEIASSGLFTGAATNKTAIADILVTQCYQRRQVQSIHY